MTDILVAPPTVEPLTLAEAKAHLRKTGSDEDAQITNWIAEAREQVEDLCDLAIVLQTRRLWLDRLPAQIDILRKPLRAVQSIQYLDSNGTLQTLAASQYRLDKASHPVRITPAYNVTWPTTYPVTNAVRVTYTAGILLPFTAAAATDLLTCASHGFADTDITQVATLGGTLPAGLAANTNYHVRDAATDTLKLAATSGGAAIDLTSDGTVPNALGSLPHRVRSLMQLLIGHRFENREPYVVGVSVSPVGHTLENLIGQLRATWRA